MKIERIRDKLKKKQPHLTLIEYNGYYNEAVFFDVDYGEFSGSFQTVSSGKKSHPKRVAKSKKNSSFDKASKNLSEKQPHLKLVEYTSRNKDCTVIDIDYGELSGNFDRIILGKLSHPKRLKARRFLEAKEKISSKFPKIKLIKYSGANKPCLFEDLDNGFFEDKYSNVLSRGSPLIDKSKDEAVKLLNDRFEYLTLIEYSSKGDSLFIDSEYGEFKGKFSKVVNGSKRHPERSAKNKKEAAKKQSVKDKRAITCIEKYGHATPLNNPIIKNKIKKTNIERYGHEYSQSLEVIQKARATRIKNGNALDLHGMTGSEAFHNSDLTCSETTFLKLVHSVGYEKALKYNNKTTDIEFIIKTFLEDLRVNFVFNKYLEREKSNNYRPDFVIGNLIIEVDGLKYHSDLHQKDKNYHLLKKNFYNNKGYDSLFFRSDEILNKTNIVYSMIKSRLGKLDNKYFARKCYIKEINRNEHIAFFNQNHLMGKGMGRTVALLFENEIVAALSFIEKKEYLEVSRYCNKLNSQVLGGFSRLLKYCIKKYKPKKVLSFVDHRYGDGHSLIKLDFVEESSHLSFKWTDFKNTFHRMKFPGNSGYEHNLYKIWDCGQKKFIKIIKES